jgi:adenylate kinase family enzyme
VESDESDDVKRLLVLGPGGSGKSTFAVSLGRATGVPVIELDARFWSADLEAMPRDDWANAQEELAQHDAWIMDGDLGPYDVLHVRLRAAASVVILDLPAIVCVWRSVRRSSARLDYWRWVFMWRRRYRPLIMQAIDEQVDRPEVWVVRSARQANEVLEELVHRWNAT